MSDDHTRAMFAAALERLRADLLAKVEVAELPADSAVRTMMIKTLDRLRAQLEHDPAGFEQEARELGITLGRGPKPNRT